MTPEERIAAHEQWLLDHDRAIAEMKEIPSLFERLTVGELLDGLDEAAEWIEEHGSREHQTPWLIHRDVVREAMRRLQAVPQGEPPQTWQPIASAPKDGTWIFVFGRGWDHAIPGAWSGYSNTWIDYEGTLVGVTHWMPLPAPPAPEDTPRE